MKPEEEEKFYALIAKTIETNWEKDMSAERLRIWWMALRNYSFQAVGEAVAEYIKKGSPYWPQVSDIVRLIEKKEVDRADLYPLIEHRERELSRDEALAAIQKIYDHISALDQIREKEFEEERRKKWNEQKRVLLGQRKLMEENRNHISENADPAERLSNSSK